MSRSIIVYYPPGAFFSFSEAFSTIVAASRVLITDVPLAL